MNVRNLPIFVALLGLILVTGCVPATAEEPVADLSGPALASVGAPTATLPPQGYPTRSHILPTPTYPPGPYPPPTGTAPPELSQPTDRPEPTPPPVPTQPPTPAVTPIPTAAPPIIPLPEGTTPQPFHLYYREGDVIMSLSSTGEEEPAVFLDPAAEFGLHLVPEEAYLREWGAFSPDGRQLALLLTEASNIEAFEQNGSTYGAFILDIDSEQLRLLVENGAEPVWSPNAQRISYRSRETGGLWVVDVTSGEAHEVYEVDRSERAHNVESYTWAPDSQRLALIDSVQFESTELLIVNADIPGFRQTLINTPDFPRLYVPEWSPIEDRIVLVWDEPGRYGNLRIRYVDLDGNVGDPAPRVASSGGPPHWSPDGKWIIASGIAKYESDLSQADLWVISSMDSLVERITFDKSVKTSPAPEDPNDLNDSFPRWSPDGISVVYFRGNELWIYKLSNGMSRMLPNLPRGSDTRFLINP